MVLMGIYQLKNVLNGKVYIGSSFDIINRFKCHKNELNRGVHHNQYLQNAWNKYGEQNFKFEIIERLDYEEDVLKVEQYYLDFFEPWKHEIGYNISPDAYSAMKGRKHSVESNLKNSLSHLWKKSSNETKQKQSKSLIGKKKSLSHRQHISEAKIGIKNPMFGKHPPNYKKTGRTLKELGHKQDCKCSFCFHKSGKEHYLFGKSPSLEARKKMSESAKKRCARNK